MRNLQVNPDIEQGNRMWVIKDSDTGKTIGRVLMYEELKETPGFVDDASIAFTINCD